MKNFSGISPFWILIPCIIMMFGGGGSLYRAPDNSGFISTQSSGWVK